MSHKICVIAEAGVNHNGDFEMARRLIGAAAATGADIVKFQTFRSEALATSGASKAAYQVKQTGSNETQQQMLRRLELSHDAFRALARIAADEGIAFLSTPFDPESLAFLVNDLGLDRIKLGSGEITNAPLLLAAARSGCDIILSTGMSTLAEVADAVGVLGFGYVAADTEAPSYAAFADALRSQAGRDAVQRHVILLHCTSQYPAPPHDANLRAMDTLRDTFGTAVGFSDHTAGIAVSLAAAARGAVVIEKHLTLDNNLPGPDHAASLEPGEFSSLVSGIREIEQAIGTGVKDVQPSEVDTRGVARKSLVALAAIKKGEVFADSNLGMLRPGTGISAMHYWDWLGRTAQRDYQLGEMIVE